MPTIKLSEETFRALQELAEPLVDTPDAIIRRLIEESESQEPERKPKRHGRRAPKGEKTPTEAFYGPIIKVLRESDGELPTGEAVDRVGELMEDTLNEVDYATLKSGEVRWRNTVRFARHDLVKMGKLKSDSPFGIWQLADDGAD